MNKRSPPTAWPDWFHLPHGMFPAVEQSGWPGKRHVFVDTWEDAERMAADLIAGRRTFKDVFGQERTA